MKFLYRRIMPAKSRKRMVNITLDENLLGDSEKLRGVVARVERTTGQKVETSPRLMKYGVLTAQADVTEKASLGKLEGVVSVETVGMKHISE